MEAILTDEECNVDACVLGTGLTESLAAAALARHGRKVLHLDRAGSYGGNWKALNFADLEKWAAGVLDSPPPAAAEPSATDAGVTTTGDIPDDWVSIGLEEEEPESCFCSRQASWDPYREWEASELDELQKRMRKTSNQFSVDIVPRLLFGRSQLVDVLVESGVARYLEFQGLQSARVLTPQGLVSVPLTKSEIFQDPVLTLPEKRLLMRFITSMTPLSLSFQSAAQVGVDQAGKVQQPAAGGGALEGVDPDEPWPQFLDKQKLSKRLQEFLTYAICLWDWTVQAEGDSASGSSGEVLTVREGLACLGRFVSSLGLHGRGTSMPLLYPMYGAAEMAQGFTRMCALHRGVYALRTSITKFLAAKDAESGKWAVKGVVTNRGEVIRTQAVITSRDHFWRARSEPSGSGSIGDASKSAPSAALAADPPVAASVGRTKALVRCRRLTAILDCPLLSESGLHLCVVPPSAAEPPLANVVQVLQLDWSTGSCPRGYTVVHISQAQAGSIQQPSEDAGDDLCRVLEQLLGFVEGGRRHCIWRCTYEQQPRSCGAWPPDASAAALDACLASAGLVLCNDPPAVPQLLAGQEVSEAVDIFLQAPIYGELQPTAEEFLRKPAHVAAEERSSGMEELASFNEQMLDAGALSAGEAAGAAPAPSVQQAAAEATSSS